FRMLAENVPGVIYLCNNDADYSMIYLNDKVMDVTGYPKEDFLKGKLHFTHLYHPDERETIAKAVDEALKARTNIHITYRSRHRSGEWRWVEEYGGGVYEGENLQWLE